MIGDYSFLCLLHATRAPHLGWPILALDILQFPFDHPGLAFQVGQDIRQGEDTSPISGPSGRPMSHDVVVHMKFNKLNVR